MEREFDAIVAGHLCIDVYPRMEGGATSFEEIFVPGKLNNVGPAVTATGGVVSNVGQALIRLGVRTRMMAKLGEDLFGRAALEIMRTYGAAEGISVVSGESSSYTFILAPPNVDRVFLHHPGANDTFGPEDVDFDAVARSRLFHFGYPPLMRRLFTNNGVELTEIMRRAKDTGVTTGLDMTLPDPASESGRANWDHILRETLPFVDIFLPSVEEAMFMADRARFDEVKAQAGRGDILDHIGPQDARAVGEKLLAYGTKIAVIKCGYKGLYVATADAEALSDMGAAQVDVEKWSRRELWQETFHVDKIASAAGAGDCTIAGFLAALLRGEKLEMCLRYGCAVGAQNVTAIDTISGVTSWDQTQAMVAADPATNPLDIDSPDWRHGEVGGIWLGSRDREF